MQTFLPYSEFQESAYVLDKKRAWKQVVECKQILCSLRANGLPQDWINSKSYQNQVFKNHPARIMWSGYEELLKQYFNDFLVVCKKYHKINTKMELLNINTNKINRPFWLGDDKFHRAMRARLIEKDEKFYLPKFPNDKNFNDNKYLWPINESKTYKTI